MQKKKNVAEKKKISKEGVTRKKAEEKQEEN
jgi:hypothetical protein